MTAAAILEQEFLPLRAKLVEIAAALDRLDRAGGAVGNDGRIERIHAAIGTLLTCDHERAEQIQLLFSRPYESGWKKRYGIV